MRETTYRFAPHPADGFLLGLRIPQLLGFVVAGALALALLRVGGLGALALALACLVLAACVLLVPVHGRTLEQWAPLTVRFLLGRYGSRSRFHAQRAQLGHLVALPAGGLDPQPPEAPWSLPAELADLEFLEARLAQYENARFGVVKDRGARTFTAALRIRGRAFALLAPDEREQRLQDYGAVLAALARDDCPVRRIAWIERTLPGDSDALGDYLLEAKRADASLQQPPEELISYLSLIGRAGDVAEEHELTFTLQIDAQRPAARRAIKRMGGGELGALAVLAGEIGQLIELLDAAAITVTGILTRRGLAATIRDAYDPWGRRDRQRQLERGASLDEGDRAAHRRPDGARRALVTPRHRWGASLHVLGLGVAADRRACAVPAAAVDGLADHAHDRDVHGAGRPEQGDPPRRARRDRDGDRAEPARQGGAAHQPPPAPARPGGRPARARARRRTRGRALRDICHRQRPGRRARRARRA